MAAKKITFENAFQRLEEITLKLEDNSVGLETSVELYKEGMDLLKICSGKLSEAEKTIYKLTQKADGSFEETPLDTDQNP